jgi:AcrR family transcriptional regulator/DNA-binding MarR family transcriptional regulator
MAAARSRGRGGVLDGAGLDGAVVPARAVSGDAVSQERVVAEMQRSRLLAAAVRVLEDQGYEHATVAHITHRARVSRRTFYELFANREQCIAAVLGDIAERVTRELREAGLQGLSWRERMRGGLWVILCFLEREPELGRVMVVHALRGSGPVLRAREQIVDRLVALVDEGRGERAKSAGCSELTAEGVVGATLAILYSRLARTTGEQPRLTGLLGELTGTIVLPYLGPAVAQREQTRPALTATAAGPLAPRAPRAADPLQGLPMRLTYRTARALESVTRHPGASNRQIADYAGIADQGQVSKLLARLESLGLISNHSAGRAKGAPNEWALTARGADVARAIALHLHTASEQRAA